MSIEEHRIIGGAFDGHVVRVTNGTFSEVLTPDRARVIGVPLRLLAKEYATDADVWIWLKARGFSRPYDRIPESQRNTRRVNMRMRAEDYARLDAVARARGGTIAQAVAWLLARESAAKDDPVHPTGGYAHYGCNCAGCMP